MKTTSFIKKNKNKFMGTTPIILIVLVFIFSTNFMISAIRTYNYSHLEDESYRLTKSYSNNLETAIDAREITTNLMEERIKAVAIAVANMGLNDDFNNLTELADTFNVDNIYLYSSNREIIQSSDGNFIGWKVPDEHPINNFLTSGETFFVEDVRADTESGILFKYGYYRLSDGRFLQIGVLAEKVLIFLNTFEIQMLIEKIFEEESILNASFFNREGIIISSSEGDHIGSRVESKEIQTAIEENSENSFITEYMGENAFQVLIPVSIEGELEGTLSIIHSLKSTNDTINDFIFIGAVALTIIFSLLIIFNVVTYRNNSRLEKMAYYDTLTGLPNRESLVYELKEIIKLNKNNILLLLININDFKSINMTYGYEYGDSILRIISKKLNSLYSEKHRLFRFSSDRFVMLIDNPNKVEEVEEDIVEIVDILEREFFTQGQKRTVEINMGIVRIDGTYKKPDEIIRDATIAVSYVDGRNYLTHAFYDKAMLNKIRREETIESEIIGSLVDPRTEKLFLMYQPIIDTRSKKTVGFEALARLKTDAFGYVSPTEFIEITERRHLINRLGEWIFQSSLLFLKQLEYEGYEGMKISVNISGVQLMDSSFRSKIMDRIISSRINPKNVNLEVTESVLFDNYEFVNKTLRMLRDDGITISLDDFGTGYSSFARLRELNIDCIKLDKTFINNIGEVMDENLLSGDIISLSHRLGLKVVAEGVENLGQVMYLEKKNCDMLQGYYFSKPLLIDDAIQFLRKQQ